MKCILTLGISLLMFMTSYAQDGATVRIYWDHFSESKIVVVYYSGESEVIPLEPIKRTREAARPDEDLIRSQKVINKVFVEMREKGLMLKSMVSVEGGAAFCVFEPKD